MLLLALLLACFFFGPEDGGSMFLQSTVNFCQAAWYHIPEDNTFHSCG
jgi:hypothetical protein